MSIQAAKTLVEGYRTPTQIFAASVILVLVGRGSPKVVVWGPDTRLGGYGTPTGGFLFFKILLRACLPDAQTHPTVLTIG